MARRAWPLIKDLFLNLVNDCLMKGSFPNIWKNAEVVAILKGPGKDPSLANSYRPISLLSIFSKVTERIICRRIEEETRERISHL